MKNKRKTILKIIFYFTTLVLITFVVNSCYDKSSENVGETNQIINSGEKENIGITENPVIPNPKAVAIPGWESITIGANTKRATVEFYNPEANMDMFYLTFELRLLNDNDENYEVLYKSDFIKPGEKIQEIELSRKLDVGEYSAIVYAQPYRMNAEKTPTNNAEMKVKLIVK